MSRSVADIQADLVVAYASRRSALQASEYSINSGQGSQSVKRDLKEINNTIASLESELADADGTNDGNVIFATGDRGAI